MLKQRKQKPLSTICRVPKNWIVGRRDPSSWTRATRLQPTWPKMVLNSTSIPICLRKTGSKVGECRNTRSFRSSYACFSRSLSKSMKGASASLMACPVSVSPSSCDGWPSCAGALELIPYTSDDLSRVARKLDHRFHSWWVASTLSFCKRLCRFFLHKSLCGQEWRMVEQVEDGGSAENMNVRGVRCSTRDPLYL